MSRIALVTALLVSVSAAFEAPEWALPASSPDYEPIYALVDSDALNLRDAPSLDGNRIGTLHRGDRVKILEYAAEYDHDAYPEYIWAEILTDEGSGYVAVGVYDYGRISEPYLVFEHNFGEYELETEADLDGDGTLERIYAGPGEMYVQEEPYWYETGWYHYLPIILRVEGSVDAEFHLVDIVLDILNKPYPLEELPQESSDHGWWSLYYLLIDDITGDGRPEIKLCFDFFPLWRGIGRVHSTRREVAWFTLADGGLRQILGYYEEIVEPYYYGDDGGWTAWGRQFSSELAPTADGFRCRTEVNYIPQDEVDPFRYLPELLVSAEIGPQDRVTHTLAPPNYLRDCKNFALEFDLKWYEDLGVFAPVFPPGNRFGERLGLSPTMEYYCNLMVGSLRGEYRWGYLDEEVGLMSEPVGGERVVTTEAGKPLTFIPFETRDDFRYLCVFEGTTGWCSAVPVDIEY
ncbi:SH3 domain-containing protein [bacterium]|nr:SH3 domain-containing protein [bacterium]